MRIGITELIVVFIVALFAVGPDRLPAFAKKLGQAVSQFRKYSEEAAREIKEGVVEPLEEVQEPLREAVKPLEDLDKSVRGDVKDLQDAFNGIGKAKQPEAGRPGAETGKKPETEPGAPAAETEAKPAEKPAPEAEPSGGETPGGPLGDERVREE